MAARRECRASNFLQYPFCSFPNAFLFLLVVAFVAASIGFVAWHIYLDIQAQYLRRQADAEYQKMIEEDEQQRLLEDSRFAGPPSRDRHGPDNSSSPPPNPARVGQRWVHFRRMMGLKTPTTASTRSAFDTASSSSSSSDTVYIGGNAGRARSRGRRVNLASNSSAQSTVRQTDVDTLPAYGGLDFALGPTRQGAIAQRRRSSSGEGIFAMDLNE